MTSRLQRGFTLLELVVALGIFAILALMAYGGLDSVLSSRRAVEQRFDRTAKLQKAYMRMRADFQQIRARPIRDSFGDVQPALSSALSNPALEFTRGGWRNPRLSARSSMERVAYRLVEQNLIRSSWRVLDRVQGAEPNDIVLLEGVDALTWRFLDDDLMWQNTWPPANERSQVDPGLAPPPKAVEVTLQTKSWSEIKLLFRSGYMPLPKDSLTQ